MTFGSKTLCANAGCGHWGSAKASADSAAVCAHCSEMLPRLKECRTKPCVVVVAGSERCGKTTWLMRACMELGRTQKPFDFHRPSDWDSMQRALYLGVPVPPTSPGPGFAWCFDRVKGNKQRRVYVYDTNGAEWVGAGSLERYGALRHLAGVVIVVDPFSLRPVLKRYGSFLGDFHPPVEVAGEPFGEAGVSNLIRMLEIFGVGFRQGKWDVRVAVVVTKLDVMGLSLQFRRETSPAPAASVCRRNLERWEFGNMIRTLESRFHHVGYFAVCSQENSRFSAAEPVDWLSLVDASMEPNE